MHTHNQLLDGGGFDQLLSGGDDNPRCVFELQTLM